MGLAVMDLPLDGLDLLHGVGILAAGTGGALRELAHVIA